MLITLTWLLMLFAQRPKELYVEQADVWVFAFAPFFKPLVPAHSKHIFYLVSDPRPDARGRIYFRAGCPLLFDRYAAEFRSADDAYSAAIAEGFAVKDIQ
jgi:hypothetical protein